MKAIIGRKIGMSQLIDDDGVVVPLTIVQAGPCTVVDIKTKERDGYSSVQLGFEVDARAKKPQVGHAKKAGATPKFIKEFKVSDQEEAIEVGASFDVSAFEIGDLVAVTGISKGKGFAGTVKRHNFARGPETHGSRNVRKVGSIGSMYPQKVYKGRKLPGQMGVNKVTTINQKVAFIDASLNVIGIRGAVPGPRNAIVTILGGVR